MDWIKRAATNVFIVVVSVGITAFVFEGAMRYTSLTKLLAYDGMPRGYYVLDAELGYDIAPDFATATSRFADGSFSVWSNEFGCFDMPYGGESPHILLLGDSFTWGFASFERKWGSVMEKTLGLRVLKCGVAGYGTRQEIAKGKRLIAALPEVPKIVLLGYFYNDPEDDAAFPNRLVYDGQLVKNMGFKADKSFSEMMRELPHYGELSRKYCMWNEPEHPTLQQIKCLLSRHSILYALVKNAVKSTVSLDVLRKVGVVNKPPESEAIQTQPDYTGHFDRIERFAEDLKMKKSRLVVVLIPSRESIEVDRYVQTRTTLDSMGISYVDLTEAFRAAQGEGRQLFWTKDMHWNEAGNELAGREVAAYIRAIDGRLDGTEREP